MNNSTGNNIYDEQIPSTEDIPFPVDLDANISLYTHISNYQEYLRKVKNPSIYFVSSGTAYPNDISTAFIEYVKDIGEVPFYFRGVLLLDNIRLLTHPNLAVNKDIRVIYHASNLSNILAMMLKYNTEVFNRFIKRYSEKYYQYSLIELDRTELSTFLTLNFY